MGNCFSLKGEHDNARKFFLRAIQLDPSFAYPHTLMGAFASSLCLLWPCVPD